MYTLAPFPLSPTCSISFPNLYMPDNSFISTSFFHIFTLTHWYMFHFKLNSTSNNLTQVLNVSHSYTCVHKSNIS